MKSTFTILLGLLIVASSFLGKGFKVYENICRTSETTSTSLYFKACDKLEEQQATTSDCCKKVVSCCSEEKTTAPSYNKLCCTSQLKSVNSGFDYTSHESQKIQLQKGAFLKVVEAIVINNASITSIDKTHPPSPLPLLPRKIHQWVEVYLI